jgi:hypothetical protein
MFFSSLMRTIDDPRAMELPGAPARTPMTLVFYRTEQ